ncbi:Epidermal growth factor receptor substrate 15 [Galdieria sulphuraria]|nr:Epidermal growth factor receptor substrate 15 [Galdieria sulphuraria]
METRRMNGGTNMNPNNKNVNSNNGMQDPSGQPSDLPPPPSYDEIMDSQGKSGMNNPSTGSAATPSPPTSDKSGKAGNFFNIFKRFLSSCI